MTHVAATPTRADREPETKSAATWKSTPKLAAMRGSHVRALPATSRQSANPIAATNPRELGCTTGPPYRPDLMLSITDCLLPDTNHSPNWVRTKTSDNVAADTKPSDNA